MGLIEKLLMWKNNPEYMYGYLIGKMDAGSLDEEVAEDMRERVAERMEGDLVSRLEEERDFLLMVVSQINEATQFGELPDGETEEKTSEGMGYIG